MEKFKGTPAPWTLPHFADDSCTCDCGFVLVEGHCGAVATVHYSKDNSVKNGDNPLPEQCVANAHLIAAAPELLEAFQKLCDKCNEYNIEALAPEYEAAMTIIQKALNIQP